MPGKTLVRNAAKASLNFCNCFSKELACLRNLYADFLAFPASKDRSLKSHFASFDSYRPIKR